MATTLPFHNKVSLDAMFDEDCIKTFNVSGGVTAADVGKAVTLDTTAANTVKIADDGDVILGRLETVEVRSSSQRVGAVAMCGSFRLPIGANVVAVGDTLQGAASGVCKKLTTANWALNVVVELVTYAGANYAVVQIGR